MTLGEATLLSAGRGLGVAVLACAAAHLVRGTRWSRAGVFVPVALAMVLLTPSILVAYTWSDLVLSVASPWVRSALYVVLLAFKLLPIAVIVLHFAPAPPMDAEAAHCLRLAPRGSGLGVARLRRAAWKLIYGAGRTHMLAIALVFVLAFQEFEMASLFGEPSWTVWLFDAQVGGAGMGDSLGFAAGPVAVEMVVIVLGLWSLVRQRGSVSSVPAIGTPAPAGAGVLGAAIVAICAYPAVRLLSDALPSVPAVLTEGPLASGLLASLMIASIVTLAAMLVSGWLLRCSPGVAAAAAAPGLCGALALGLLVQGLFQLPGISLLYDTPIPLLLALGLLLIPAAVLLRIVLDVAVPGPEVHAADLLSGSRNRVQARAGRRILATLVGRRCMGVLLILFSWVYFEVVASALLAPAHMMPSSVLLYNLMHYGQSSALSAMVTLMIGSLVLLFCAAIASRSLYQRLTNHG